MEATRETYGKTLTQLGEKNTNIVVLDADLSEATKTCDFAKRFPERFFDIGIAEQDMLTTAAGFATCSKIPFASTFAVFACGRAYDQIRNSICYPNLNVKIAATHAGITVGEDGATHQMLEDINIMKGLPNMTVLCPSDEVSTKKIIELAAEKYGPVYIRLTRPKVDNIYTNETFEIGGSNNIGDGNQVCIFTNGITLHECIRAKEMLEKDGVSVRVIDLYSIKPIDEKSIVENAQQVDKVICVEDHNIVGGIGSIVSDVLSQNYPKKVYKIGIDDRFGKSGKYDELLKEYGIDSENIYNRIKEIVYEK